MMLSLFYMNMMIGGLIAIVVPYGTQARWGGDVNDLRAFRVALYAALALPTITLILELFLLVESPYYLLMRGRKEEARKSLDYINGTAPGYDSDRALAELEYTLEKEAELATLEKDSSYLDCFKGVDRRRTFCAVFPAITQNLTGQNLTGTYMTYFFSLAGESDPLISSVISSVLSLFANFCTFFLLENKRIGRWRLLFGGVIVMTFSMLAIALIDTINHSSFNYASGVMLFFFVALFGAASAMGPGAAGWVYTGESGSSRLRSKCTTLGTVGNAIVGLVMTSVIPYLLDADEANWGAKTGYLFFGLGLGCCVVIYFFIPEYSGRSFAQLDELFERRIPARKFASTVCTGEYGRDLEE